MKKIILVLGLMLSGSLDAAKIEICVDDFLDDAGIVPDEVLDQKYGDVDVNELLSAFAAVVNDGQFDMYAFERLLTWLDSTGRANANTWNIIEAYISPKYVTSNGTVLFSHNSTTRYLTSDTFYVPFLQKIVDAKRFEQLFFWSASLENKTASRERGLQLLRQFDVSGVDWQTLLLVCLNNRNFKVAELIFEKYKSAIKLDKLFYNFDYRDNRLDLLFKDLVKSKSIELSAAVANEFSSRLFFDAQVLLYAVKDSNKDVINLQIAKINKIFADDKEELEKNPERYVNPNDDEGENEKKKKIRACSDSLSCVRECANLRITLDQLRNLGVDEELLQLFNKTKSEE